MTKLAVLSMDVEEWTDLDYFLGKSCAPSFSMLDGLDVFSDILQSESVPATFFVLGRIAESIKVRLSDLAAENHEIAVHGWDHTRPLTMEPERFVQSLERSKKTLEDVLGKPVTGHRAPCFSLDDERLAFVREAGFCYDSSRMPFPEHPLYGSLKMDGFRQVSRRIHRLDDFFEFELSTSRVFGRNIPVSGGAYLRIFPWFLTRWMLQRLMADCDLYVLYIHPFELSKQPNPPMPEGVSRSAWLRFLMGRKGMAGRVCALIKILRAAGFEFTTFEEIRNRLLEDTGDGHAA